MVNTPKASELPKVTGVKKRGWQLRTSIVGGKPFEEPAQGPDDLQAESEKEAAIRKIKHRVTKYPGSYTEFHILYQELSRSSKLAGGNKKLVSLVVDLERRAPNLPVPVGLIKQEDRSKVSPEKLNLLKKYPELELKYKEVLVYDYALNSAVKNQDMNFKEAKIYAQDFANNVKEKYAYKNIEEFIPNDTGNIVFLDKLIEELNKENAGPEENKTAYKRFADSVLSACGWVSSLFTKHNEMVSDSSEPENNAVEKSQAEKNTEQNHASVFQDTQNRMSTHPMLNGSIGGPIGGGSEQGSGGKFYPKRRSFVGAEEDRRAEQTTHLER